MASPRPAPLAEHPTGPLNAQASSSPVAGPAPQPAKSLHTHDLSFSLASFDVLTSTQLALVQFHPAAEDDHIRRARALFVRRRMEWLEEKRERARAAEEEAARAQALVRAKREDTGGAEGEGGDEGGGRACVPPKGPGHAGAAQPSTASARAPAAIVKREVEEISLLDDDDDDGDNVAMPAPMPPRPAAKRRSAVPAGATRPSPLKKRRSDLGPPATARSSEAPRRATSDTPGPSQVSSAERLKGMRSFRRKESDASPTGLGPSPTPTPPPAVRHPLAPSVSTLVRRPPPAPPPTSADVPLPVFKPNIALAVVRTGRGIQNALRSGIPPAEDDHEYPHWVSPPAPFPDFAALRGPVAEQGADDLAPFALAKRLYTVRISGLSTDVTATLLFYFILRNMSRLRPRPLAIRTAPAEASSGLLTGVWYFAFGSLDAAKLIVADNHGRKLPDMDDYQPRGITATLVRGELPADPTFEQRRASDAQDLAIAWKWGELSNETRHAWTKYADLPSSPVCPRFPDDEDEDRTLSDEYGDEVRIIQLESAGDLEDAEEVDRRGRLLATTKRAMYMMRGRIWRQWMRRPPAERAAAVARREHVPAWPVWPSDDDVLLHEAAAQKASTV
ncbi:hypothetical protein JCM3770_000418 [Rhodotorula araucariae]